MTQNSNNDIRSRELALAYFFKFEDQEEVILVLACASNRFKGRASLEDH